MHYVEPVFRPPSEAWSTLLQVTVGCSRNRCTFCGMYATKKFGLAPLDEIIEDIEEARRHPQVRRVFLLDGDALAAPEENLASVLVRIRERMPWTERVGVYGDARSILAKGPEGMRRLRALGLGIVYHGIESGSPEVLRRVRKEVSFDEMAAVRDVMKASGVKHSVMALLGLGGEELSSEHARDTAKALTILDPDYIGLLTLMLVPGTALARAHDRGQFVLPDRTGMLRELRTVLAGLDVTSARFSANHASNYLPITGDLPVGKEDLLRLVDRCLEEGDDSLLRPEWRRGL
jgi:radical SAM superfamily enzyme YgiQ (UPF0313 family)